MLQKVFTAKRPAPHEAACAVPGPEVAVLLNAKAKAVNARSARPVAGRSRRHLFFSTSHEEATAIAGRSWRGGTDGLHRWRRRHVRRVGEPIPECRAARARPPRFGVLALGTGNAVAEMVG
jgi:hypothetical protein